MEKRKLHIIEILMLLLSLKLYAKEIKTIEFSNQNINDIVLILSRELKTSITLDETVEGNYTFYSTIEDAEKTLKNFCEKTNLYAIKENDSYKITKIKIEFNKENQTLSINTNSTEPEKVLNKISKAINKTIVYEKIPSQTISLNITDLKIKDAIELCIKGNESLEVTENENYFYIHKKTEAENTNSKQTRLIEKKGNQFSIKTEQAQIKPLLMDFFIITEKQYSFLFQNDVQIKNLNLKNLDFYEFLNIILEQANLDYTESNGIFYILESEKKNSFAGRRKTIVYNLKYLPVEDFSAFIPQELSPKTLLKDKERNSIVISGTERELETFVQYIKQIDIEENKKHDKIFDLKYITYERLINFLPPQLKTVNIVSDKEKNRIICTSTKQKLLELEKLINEVDTRNNLFPISLKYIKKEELIEKLPSFISKDKIINTNNPNLLFFTGNKNELEDFNNFLSYTDKPLPQIKYQILVVQYTKNKNYSIKPEARQDLSNAGNSNDSTYIFNADLSNILSLNFDVISKLGYQFAINLNSQLSQNIANVFTDTSLTGLSGETIQFQNTDTYRYIEYELDKTTLSKTSSTTQTITSGLIVEINGWISGDNMITMEVNATVSKQNAATDSGLPSTSERIINTKVRTESGKPVIISGLIKEEINENKSLIWQKSKSKEQSEIVIYLIPYLDNTYNKAHKKLNRMRKIYEGINCLDDKD